MNHPVSHIVVTGVPAPSTEPPAAGMADWAQAAGRMLVAAFFLTSAVANMGDSALELRPVLHVDLGLLAQVAIYAMAFALLVGRQLRLVALVLGLILLASSSAALLSGQMSLAAYWQDLALVGALGLLASQSRPRTGRRPCPPPGVEIGRLPRAAMRHHVARPTGHVSLPVSAPR